MKICVLIVAAGKGLRAGGCAIPKQYQPIGDRPVLSHTIDAFAQVEQVSDMTCAINPEHESFYHEAIKECDQRKLSDWVSGRETRQKTVAKALEEVAKTGATHVLIHDAARPFVSQSLIQRIITALHENKVVLPAVRVTDTIKFIENNFVKHTVDRTPLWAAQTPQAFDLRLISEFHEKATKDGQEAFTDDIALAEWQDQAIYIVEGESNNTKITTADDLIMADFLMKMKENR